MPAAISSAAYDQDNRITNWNGTTWPSTNWDNDGNLLTDGTNSYTWNARNQLTAISGGTTASFSYDAFGRRQSKTTSGTATSFLYDGLNAVQERVGGSITANLLTGGLDEVFARTEGTTTRALLADALGSTVALVEPGGSILTQYQYEPYGQTTVLGTASGNPSQYTGRENDGTGLYYYRARYYSPTYQRFLSEYPLGFGGGDVNLYAYAGNAPTKHKDPLGLTKATREDLTPEDPDWEDIPREGDCAPWPLCFVNPQLAAALGGGAGVTVTILENDEGVVWGTAETPNGIIEFMGNLTMEGRLLIVRQLHIEGAGSGTAGLLILSRIVQALGRQFGATEVEIHGGVRTTGANPGHIPRPIRVPVPPSEEQ